MRGHDTTQAATPTLPSGPPPLCQYVNVVLCGSSPSAGATGKQATVLLENPKGHNAISTQELIKQVRKTVSNYREVRFDVKRA